MTLLADFVDLARLTQTLHESLLRDDLESCERLLAAREPLLARLDAHAVAAPGDLTAPEQEALARLRTLDQALREDAGFALARLGAELARVRSLARPQAATTASHFDRKA
jgi:hypothetical protein